MQIRCRWRTAPTCPWDEFRDVNGGNIIPLSLPPRGVEQPNTVLTPECVYRNNNFDGAWDWKPPWLWTWGWGGDSQAFPSYFKPYCCSSFRELSWCKTRSKDALVLIAFLGPLLKQNKGFGQCVTATPCTAKCNSSEQGQHEVLVLVLTQLKKCSLLWVFVRGSVHSFNSLFSACHV